MPVAYNKIEKEIIGILENKLADHYIYHCVAHTRYVIKLAEYIAKKEKINKRDLRLVKIAALFHDVGFIKSPIEHEKEGCKIARKELKNYDYPKEDIKKICGMIMATKIPQNPKNLLEQIVADADLEYLSTKNFIKFGERLYEELKHFNSKLSRKQWNDIQINFLEQHSYKTSFCKRYKEHRKRKNLAELKNA